MSADPDDSLAANQEPTDLGRSRSRQKPANEQGHWGIAWIPGPDPAAPVASRGRECQRCHKPGEGGILLQDPATRHPERVLCARCQGKANAEIHGYARGGREP